MKLEVNRLRVGFKGLLAEGKGLDQLASVEEVFSLFDSLSDRLVIFAFRFDGYH